MPTFRLSRLFLVVGLLVLTLLISPHLEASDLETSLDFAQLWRMGGVQAVAGAYDVPGPSPFPDLPVHPQGDVRNSYPWSMAWWGPSGEDPSLWVGTVRSLLCFLSPDFGGDCPVATPEQPLPLPRFPQEVAEIWNYVPAGNGGIEGTWTRVFGGPTPTAETAVPYPTKCAFVPADDQLACLLSGTGVGFPDTPQHIGIRSMVACDADNSGHPELYASNLGIPGQVIYTENGTDWLDASIAGDTFVSAADLIGGTLDLGYRGLVCWQGKVCTAPAGSFEDTDTSLHPWVICNDDPTNPTSPWIAHSEFGFGDPDDIGIFDMIVVDVEPEAIAAPEPSVPSATAPTFAAPIDGEAWLCAGGFDRTNGASIYCTDGTGCNVDVLPGPADGIRDCVWTEYVSDGMGRPSLILGVDAKGAAANAAGFGLGAFDDDDDPYDDYLYFGMADAAGGPNANNQLAEMGRINLNRDAGEAAPEGGPGPTPPSLFGTWELVAAIPRNTTDLSANPIVVGYGLTTDQFIVPPEMNCTPEPFDLGLVVYGLYGVYPGAIPAELCMPISGKGIGMGSSAFMIGDSTYLWRFVQHEGDLFVGDLDATNTGNGFELWKTSDGITFYLITSNGLNWGETNYGVRGLVSTDPSPACDGPCGAGPELDPTTPLTTPVLFLGAANPFGGLASGGGAQVWMGTTTPMLPPVAIIDGIPTLFDDDNCVSIDDCPPADGKITVDLDGTDSYDLLGGAIVEHRWWEGDFLTTCGSLVEGTEDHLGATAAPELDALGGAGAPYIFTLRVKDDDGEIDCETEAFVLSSNLPPFVEIITSPPPTGSTVRLVDFDGDGRESFGITARCKDPETSLSECFWATLDGGVTFSPERALNDPVASPITQLYVGSITALIEEDAQSLFGDSSPDVRLQAGDGYFTRTGSFDIRVESFFDTPDQNDGPDCASGTLVTLKNTVLEMDPRSETPLHPSRSPRCADADAGQTATLVLEIDSDENFGAPTYLEGTAPQGTAETVSSDTMLRYTPPTDEIGMDRFRFEARDTTPSDSNEVDVLVRVIDCPTAAGLSDIDLVLDGVTLDLAGSPWTKTGCLTVTSLDTTVEAGVTATFEAAEGFIFGDGFVVEAGAIFEAVLDPSLIDE